MMPYEILYFVIPNAKYQRKRFIFKCRNFDPEIGNIGTVSNFWTLSDKILWGSFELSLSGKTKSRGHVSQAHAD